MASRGTPPTRRSVTIPTEPHLRVGPVRHTTRRIGRSRRIVQLTLACITNWFTAMTCSRASWTIRKEQIQVQRPERQSTTANCGPPALRRTIKGTPRRHLIAATGASRHERSTEWMLVRKWVGLFLALAIAPGCSSRGLSQRQEVIAQKTPGETAMESQQPTLTMRAKVERNEIKVGYEVANQLNFPIYIFDRLYDMSAEKMDPNWAYVDLSSDRIVVCRQVWRVPEGLHHENPEVPYARTVAPGGKIKGVFA